MIISSSLALSALALNLSSNPNASPPSLRHNISPVLCYDPRYATTRLHPEECRNVIRAKILVPQFNDRAMNFSRHPIQGEFRVPQVWNTRQGRCAIVVDIPDTPGGMPAREESSIGEVRAAAMRVLAACVAEWPQLGGFAAAGKRLGLHISIEAREEGGRAVERWGFLVAAFAA
ncbi:MAG: hypothetical protein Q9208_007794 [Pyrenodesmia sp. 3 TL-2023]